MSKNVYKDYGRCKLEAPKLGQFQHLKKSTINLTIDKANQIVLCLFKQKIKPDDQTMIQLLKFFNIPVPKGNGLLLDWIEIKKPDFLYTVNMKLMQKLNRNLNESNRQAKPEQGSSFFRFFVGGGNNHPAVRQIIKRRSWWCRYRGERFIGQGSNNDYSDESEDENIPAAGQAPLKGAHLIWTQWRKTELSDHLKHFNKDVRLTYCKLEDNYHLANKKALFMNISNYYKALNYDPFEVAIPLTFHIKSQNDPEYIRFEKTYSKL